MSHATPRIQPKKDMILAKHRFSGDRTGSPVPVAGPSSSRGGGDRGFRGRVGWGRGSRRGGGGRGSRGGGQRQGGEGGGDGARDRAQKDRNKASRGNHNRKRGHDKKMARAGGPS